MLEALAELRSSCRILHKLTEFLPLVVQANYLCSAFRDKVAACSKFGWVFVGQCDAPLYSPHDHQHLFSYHRKALLAPKETMGNTTSDLHSNTGAHLVMGVSGALYVGYIGYTARMNTQRLK